jgi:hypothetical protein
MSEIPVSIEHGLKCASVTAEFEILIASFCATRYLGGNLRPSGHAAGADGRPLMTAGDSPGLVNEQREKGGWTPALAPVAIISLRRGNFLFDLDRRDIE